MGLFRLLLAMSVLLAHADGVHGYAMLGGDVAVQAFYLVSGFYMALVLNEKYAAGRAGTLTFYTNRALRIYPTYWLILVLAVAFYGGMYLSGRGPGVWGPHIAFFRHLVAPTWWYLIGSQILLFSIDLTNFLAVAPAGHLYWIANFHPATGIAGYQILFVPQAWTLGLELIFYAIAPFIVRRRPAVVALVALLSLALRIVAYGHGRDYDPWTYRVFPFELSTFLWGSLSYRAFAWLRDRSWSEGFVLWLPAAALLALTLSYPWLFAFGGGRWWYLGAVAFLLPALFLKTGRIGLDRFLGELSYPFYLCHVLVLTVIDTADPQLTGKYRTYAAIAVSIGVSALAEISVNAPIDRYRQRRVKRRAATASSCPVTSGRRAPASAALSAVRD